MSQLKVGDRVKLQHGIYVVESVSFSGALVRPESKRDVEIDGHAFQAKGRCILIAANAPRFEP